MTDALHPPLPVQNNRRLARRNLTSFATHHNAVSARNFARDHTHEERKQLTEEALNAACACQREILSLALTSQDIFERWSAWMLSRHFEQVLAGATGKQAMVEAQCGRTADFYGGRGDELAQANAGPTVGSRSKVTSKTRLTANGQFFEVLLVRYFCLFRSPTTGGAINVVRHNAIERFISLLNVSNLQAEQLSARLSGASAAEDSAHREWSQQHGRSAVPSDDGWSTPANVWTQDAIALGLFGLVSWRYISEIQRYATEGDPVGWIIRENSDTTARKIGDIVTINQPGQIDLVNRAYRPKRGDDLDDMIGCAMNATRDAAGRYHPLYGRGGFINYTRRTISSELRRAIQRTRLVRLPEEKDMLVGRLEEWRSNNLLTFSGMALDQQMVAAGINRLTAAQVERFDWELARPKAGTDEEQAYAAFGEWRNGPGAAKAGAPLAEQLVSAGINKETPQSMAQLLSDASSTQAVSIQALGATDGEESPDVADRMLGDRGRGAAVIREAATGDPRLALMRPAFDRLQPFHQALLAALHPCAITDGGEMTWFSFLAAQADQLLGASVRRIVTGVASPAQVAVGLDCKY